jgi:hypothetical protein
MSPETKKALSTVSGRRAFWVCFVIRVRLQTASGPATYAGKIKEKPIIGGLERTHSRIIVEKSRNLSL